MKFLNHTKLWQSLILVLFMFDCRQQYLPPVLQSNKNYLVVEGVIVTGDSTVITLSRTSNISDTVLPQPEPGATVTVVGQDGSMYPLTDRGDGSYFSAGLNLNVSEQYKLEIHTSNGSAYQSSFVPVKLTPPIDSVGWYQDTANNVQIYVNTHDPSNNSRYYRWAYTETWNYQSEDQSLFDWVNNQIVLRDTNSQIFNCWSSNNSTNIEIASSAKLAQDVIANQPVASVPFSSEKISFEYSILVKQYVLTEDAYNFWLSLQNTTQQLGSLFDAQPAQLQTNISCLTNPSEVVIGYISASSVQTKRIFINRAALRWNYVPYFHAYACAQQMVPPDSINYYLPQPGPRFYVLLGQATAGPDYIIVPAECADCRVHGGTNVKPSYWP